MVERFRLTVVPGKTDAEGPAAPPQDEAVDAAQRSPSEDSPAARIPSTGEHQAVGTPRPARVGSRRVGPSPSSSFGAFLVRLLAVLAVAAIGAVALGPRLVRSDLPTDPELLGTPARGIVKADRDYALVDEEATELQRLGAADGAPQVWDLDDLRAQKTAQLLQKTLVRLQVATEAVRKDARNPIRVPGSDGTKGALDGDDDAGAPRPVNAKALDDVRAVVAGELAAAGLEAPRNEEWAALLDVLWLAPGAADALGAPLVGAFVDPIARTPPGGPIDEAEAIRVRGLKSGDEETVERTEVVDRNEAQARLQTRLLAALAEIEPPEVPRSWALTTRVVTTWLSSMLVANISWNAAETELRRRAAAERVPPVIVRAFRGETVLRPGELITPRHQLLVSAMSVQQAGDLRTRATVGTAFFVALVCGVVYLFGARRVFQRRLRSRDIILLAVLLSLELGLLLIADVASPRVAAVVPGAHTAMLAFALPVVFGPMCVRLTLPPDVALLFALVVALLGGVVVEGGMSWAIVTTLSAMTGVAIVTGGPRRLTMLVAGGAAGIVGACAGLTLELFRGALAGQELLMLLVACLTGGILSGLVAMVGVPIVERLFGYVTDQRLYRLADLNSPLLKDLIVHAPGTWHHSVRVAVLAEHAALAVGANPLLARVMSLYHDVGKIAQPGSFLENQHGENPHDRLSPEESATVLRAHVEEGLALAREHNIPRAIAAVIEEHHADLVMEAFLEKARGRARDDGQDEGAIDARFFRYGGRSPQTKESALVMLADQIESAARKLDESDTHRQGEIVDAFVNRALTADVLAACDLSLKELRRARAALKDALASLTRPGG